jgi:hypothetical protein
MACDPLAPGATLGATGELGLEQATTTNVAVATIADKIIGPDPVV